MEEITTEEVKKILHSYIESLQINDDIEKVFNKIFKSKIKATVEDGIFEIDEKEKGDFSQEIYKEA